MAGFCEIALESRRKLNLLLGDPGDPGTLTGMLTNFFSLVVKSATRPLAYAVRESFFLLLLI